MSRPPRVTDARTGRGKRRTFFITSQTAGGRAVFQSERMAALLIDVLRTHAGAGRFTIHDFTIMPDHVHILLTLPGELSIERAVQLIKGGFSFRAKRELGFSGEIWQTGFSDVGVRDLASFLEHRKYIEENPVKAGIVNSPEMYPYSSLYLKLQKRANSQGLKPGE